LKERSSQVMCRASAVSLYLEAADIIFDSVRCKEDS
jgi:hypothetical protein